MSPTLAGFLDFLTNTVQIPVAALPLTSTWPATVFELATEIVNPYLASVGDTVFTLATYNLATDFLINWTPDVTGNTFFADARKSFGTASFTAGFLQSTSDETDSSSLLIPEFFSQLTLAQLQLMKTPYGRAYLAFAQSWGSNWGLS